MKSFYRLWYNIFGFYFERKYQLKKEILTIFMLSKKEWLKKYPNLKPIVTCTYRSKQEQDLLYKKGRDMDGTIVTFAKGGESPHNYCPSFAFDIAFWNLKEKIFEWSDDNFILFKEIVNQLDDKKIITWGGDFSRFRDTCHFELANWNKLNLSHAD
jgi:peptidoglycan L-alanyl-D-glutamate endopeptidase CwlK